MANNFSGDANCVGVWDMESSALLVDTLGIQGNLTDNNTVTNDTTNQKVGTGCGDFEKDNSETLSRTDANLTADFPGKSSTGASSVSVVFWVKFESLATARSIVGKYVNSSGQRSWNCKLGGASSVLIFQKWTGATSEEVVFGTVFGTGKWYHCGVTFNNSDLSVRLRIWDDNASALLAADATGTLSTALTLGTAPFSIGGGDSSYTDGLLDEVAVFKDVLSVAEIDQIRAGTYGAAPSFKPYWIQRPSQIIGGGLR